jgi:hypothetical protein
MYPRKIVGNPAAWMARLPESENGLKLRVTQKDAKELDFHFCFHRGTRLG